MLKHLRPLHRLWEQFILRWARRELPPLHPIMPAIVRRLQDQEHAPSPLDPADSLVTGASILATLALLVFMLLGWVR